MRRIVLAVGLAAATAPAWPAAPNPDRLAGFQVQWDNDVWATGHTDRWYTNGIRLSWTYAEAPDSTWGRLMSDGSRWFLWRDKAPTLTYTVGQSMYTPRDITRPEPQRLDRPWGAALYFGSTAHAYEGDEFRATELKLGTTGRHAYGKATQALVHRFTDSPEPMGWPQQLRGRPLVQLTHTRVRRLGDKEEGDWFGFQWSWGLALGTVRNYANLGVAMTLGQLHQRNGPLSIGNEGDFLVQDFNNRPQFARPFGFVAASLTGVANNYYIDGRTPYGHSQVEARHSYRMFQWGVSLPLQCWIGARWPRVVFMQTLRSPEFTSPVLHAGDAQQRWGTFAVNWDTNDGGPRDCR